MVGKVNGPLGRSAIVEGLKVLTDCRPRTALFGRSDRRRNRFSHTAVVLEVVGTVDERLLQVGNVHGGPLDGHRFIAQELPFYNGRNAVRNAVNLMTLSSDRCNDVHGPRDQLGQPVMAEGAVIADIRRLVDMRRK